jgi:hypothetical protein
MGRSLAKPSLGSSGLRLLADAFRDCIGLALIIVELAVLDDRLC